MAVSTIVVPRKNRWEISSNVTGGNNPVCWWDRYQTCPGSMYWSCVGGVTHWQVPEKENHLLLTEVPPSCPLSSIHNSPPPSSASFYWWIHCPFWTCPNQLTLALAPNPLARAVHPQSSAFSSVWPPALVPVSSLPLSIIIDWIHQDC